MNIPKDIISSQPARVQTFFLQWENYMELNVEFWQIPGDLDIHTQGHCERVLMHSLRIANARGDDDKTMLALAFASIFHDTRRKDNYLDTGHGARAAEYYKAYCLKQSESSNHKAQSSKPNAQSIIFLPEAYAAIWYHDRDDVLGEKYIHAHADGEADRWMEVYHIFKDADALDRLRLGTWCLDPKYLRTEEAKGMRPFAQKLVESTIPREELEKTYKLTEPFRPTSLE